MGTSTQGSLGEGADVLGSTRGLRVEAKSRTGTSNSDIMSVAGIARLRESIASGPKSFATFDGNSFFEDSLKILPHTAFSASLWVQIREPTSDSVYALLASKPFGCHGAHLEPVDDHDGRPLQAGGFLLAVHVKRTGSSSGMLEWLSDTPGRCGRIETQQGVLTAGVWAQVGFSLTNTHATLFVDGVVVSMQRIDASKPAQLPPLVRLRMGSAPDDGGSFYGRLAQVVIMQRELSESNVRSLANVSNPPLGVLYGRVC